MRYLRRETLEFLSESPDIDNAADETVAKMAAACAAQNVTLPDTIRGLMATAFIGGALWQQRKELDERLAMLPSEGRS